MSIAIRNFSINNFKFDDSFEPIFVKLLQKFVFFQFSIHIQFRKKVYAKIYF